MRDTPTATTASNAGLSSTEAAQLHREGKGNHIPPATGKTVADIVRSNVFTRINAILGILLIAVLSTGSWINSAFGLLITINSAIGIVQELRAKHTLDSLSLIGSEHPVVRRDGIAQAMEQTDIVLGDIIELRSGNQIVVDGDICEAEYLLVNESMLTGESDPVPKQPGDRVLSGSYVLAGVGAYRVTAVGSESYAARIAAQASEYTLKKSRLQHSIDAILRYVTWVLIPVAIATIWLQWNEPDTTWQSTILAITGALVPMVPEGLVLITSTAFALGVIRLGKQNVLVQELPAIEGLARVDVLCADKTGTLTENALDFLGFIPADGFREDALEPQAELRAGIPPAALDAIPASEVHVEAGEYLVALKAFASADPDPNPTLEAIRTSELLERRLQSTQEQWHAQARQPFNSAHKWSAVRFSAQGTWVLGAPEVLAAGAAPKHEPIANQLIQRADELAARGLRTLMFARADRKSVV